MSETAGRPSATTPDEVLSLSTSQLSSTEGHLSVDGRSDHGYSGR